MSVINFRKQKLLHTLELSQVSGVVSGQWTCLFLFFGTAIGRLLGISDGFFKLSIFFLVAFCLCLVLLFTALP